MKPVVWTATGTMLLLLLFGTFLQPPLEIPDERFHVDMVQAAAAGQGWPGLKARTVGPMIIGASRLLRSPGPNVAEQAVPRRRSDDPCTGTRPPDCSARPTASQLRNLDLDPGFVNRMTQHPPFYYVMQAAVAHGVISLFPPLYGLAVDVQLWLYRLVNILLVVPLPLLSYVIARRVTASPSLQAAAAVFPLCLPALSFRNGPMVNNDNLTVLIGALVVLLLLQTIQDGLEWRRTLGVGLLVGLGALTKGTMLIFAPVVAVAYLLRIAREEEERWLGTAHLGAAGLLGALSGGWWYLRNVMRYGEIQPSGVRASLMGPAGSDFSPRMLDWASTGLELAVRTFWDLWVVPSPESALPVFLLFAVLLAVVVVGSGVGVWRLHNGRRAEVLVVVSPVIVISLAVLVLSWSRYVETSLVLVHARYLSAGLVGLAVVVPIGLGNVLGRHRRRLPWVLALFAVVLQVAATYGWLIEGWGGSSVGTRWNAMLAWAPFAPWVVNSVAGLTAGALLVMFAVSAVFDPPAGRQSAEGRRAGIE